MTISKPLNFVQNDTRAHAVILAKVRRSKRKASVMHSRGLSPTVMPPKLPGWPTFGMEHTPTTVEARGLFSMGEGPEFLAGCRCPIGMHQQVRRLMQSPSTELECSVKGFPNAVFRSCSSLTEGQIKLHLFAEHVVQMFAGPDPFSDVDDLLPQWDGVNGQQEMAPVTRPTTPAPVTPEHYPPAPQVKESRSTTPDMPPELPASRIAGSSKSAANYDGPSSSLVSSPPGPNIPRPGDGWYVAHHAVLPGVYCGV